MRLMRATAPRLGQRAAAVDRRAVRGPHVASVTVHFVRLLTDYCEQRDISARRLFAAVGLDVAVLEQADARLPFTSFARMCDDAAAQLGDGFLGLHLGQAIRPGHFGPHGFTLISCSTVREQLERSLRYSGLVFDACRNEFEERGDEVIRHWRSRLPGGASPGRLQDELNMAAWITLARWFTAVPDARPNWIAFRHPRPHDTREYEALFRCPLRFAADDTAVAFDRRYAELPLAQADPEIRAMMDALCERSLQRLEDGQPAWLVDCRRALVASFADGEPVLAAVAARIGLTPRALRYRLEQRGASFRALVESVRQELAHSYLADPSLSLVGIAYLLGFSDQSAFQRSFKRWTGSTPGDYRRSPTAPGGDPTAPRRRRSAR